jgi:hypothetical protein
MQKRFHWLEILLGMAVLLTHSYAALAPNASLLMWFRNDDAFFYFKVAQNIAAGLGSTFDGIGLANGYHPLWMLVCIPVFALARFDLYLPLRLLVILLAAFNLGTGILIFRLLSRLTRQPIAMLSAAFWAFYPGIHTQTTQGGLETGINVFFLAWLLYAVSRLEPDQPPTLRQMAKLGLLAALAVLSRLDNIFILLILGLWAVWRDEKFGNQAMAYILLTTLGVLVSFIARLGFKGFYDFAVPTMAMIAVSLAIRLPVYYFFGLMQLDWRDKTKALTQMFITVSLASGLVGLLMLSISLIPAVGGFPRSALAVDWGLALLSALLVSSMGAWLEGPERGLQSANSGRLKSALQVSRDYFKVRWQVWLKRALVYFGILGGVVLVYMAANYVLFGTPMPVSGQIKQWWGSLDTVYGKRVQDWAMFLGFNSDGRVIAFATLNEIMSFFLLSKTVPFWLLLAAYALVGFILLSKRETGFGSGLERSAWLAALTGSLIHVWSYNARGYVAIREWYWAAQMLVSIIFMAVFWDSLLKKLPAKWLAGTTTLLGIAVFVVFTNSIVKLVPYDTSRLSEDLTGDIRFLETNTEPGALIGMTGGGMAGYLIRGRTIINLDGLINSAEYFRLHRQFRSYEYLDKIGLDYVFGNGYILTESDPYGKVFAGRLTPAATFSSSHLLFHYLPGLGAQP